MAEKGSDPKDVADMLESLARRLRDDRALPAGSGGRDAVSVTPPPELLGTAPFLGALDVFTDDDAITVTAETRNADAKSVHVSLLDGRLLIDLGHGAGACRRDLPLPAAVDEDAAVATFRNGILDVVLPLRRKALDPGF